METEKQETTALVAPPELLSLGRTPEEILLEAHRAATALMAVLADKKPVIINGERFLEFEDWQTVARFFGVTSGVEPNSTTYVEFGERDSEDLPFAYGFKATAYLYSLATGQKISGAESMCLSDEPKWRRKPLFQLSSMSQTRAQAKAMRNVFSFVVVLAGFKPTPAEEMIESNGQAAQPTVAQVIESVEAKQPQPLSVDPNNMVPALEASMKEVDRKKKNALREKSATLETAQNMEELAGAWSKLTKAERQVLVGIKDGCKARLEGTHANR